MTRTTLENHNCSMARAVDIIGDKWALMILRDAFYGVRTFTAFQSRLGLAKTVLSDRLQRLSQAGVLQRVRSREGVDRFEYRLTDAGRDLFPVVIALIQWGDRWVFGSGQEPLTIVDRQAKAPVRQVAVQAMDGRVLQPRDITYTIGPGATAEAFGPQPLTTSDD
jgi:DNA-binding HxlR family transcriptional regulator